MADENQDSGEKEFEATEQKRRKAREDGNIPQSRETNAVSLYIGILICALMFSSFIGPSLFNRLAAMFHHADEFANDAFNPGAEATRAWTFGTVGDLAPAFLVLVAAIAIALFATQAVTFSAKKIKPSIKNISPIENLKKKYGAKGLIDFAKDAAKMIFAGTIAIIFLYNFTSQNFGSSALSPSRLLPFTLGQLMSLILIFLLFQAVLAAIDLPIQTRLHANKLRMTREELKKESKESEGDPHLKQSRREKAQKITNGEMLQNVKSASVVMVNPEHYAVALKWDPDSKQAPVVVAKGVDHIAAKIREVAKAHNVPIYRDPPSTRSLYRLVEIDEEILPEHFAAVAAAIQYAQSLSPEA